LKKRGSLTLSEAIDIMSQLTDGMAHAHNSYIIHRDLKPQNIMIKDDGQIKITDFGIAMALNATQLTQTNSVMGSVHYLPPEQASGKGCTIKSDIYSMGIIFYELLSGSLPFRGDNAVEIALKHMKEPLPNLRDENPSIPQSIVNIIKRSTAKNPKNRYDTAREMHEDLLTALDDERMNEEEYKYKYPESENDNRKKEKLKSAEDDITEDIKMIPKDEENQEETEEQKEKKKKKLIIILSAVFGTILVTLTGLFFIVPKLTSSKNVVVPDCEGKKVSACEKALQEVGFEVNTEIKTEASSEIKKNLVIKTNPEAGRSIKKGSKITIYKSTGEETVKLEDYTGKNAVEVKTLLETKYGLKVKIEKKEVDDKNKEYSDDEIVGQSLAKGSELKKGETLTLYTAKNDVVFPNFAEEGYSKDDVAAFCDKYGLNCTYTEEQTSSVPEGKIISQSRLVGSTVSKGTNLTVKYAVKPKATPSPSTTTKVTENKESSNSNSTTPDE
jgi:serine/threonine-protein kinase